MKPICVKTSIKYIDFESNDRDSKFKVDDRVRISKHQNIFAKRLTTSWWEDDFVIRNVKKNCTMEVCDRKLQ